MPIDLPTSLLVIESFEKAGSVSRLRKYALAILIVSIRWHFLRPGVTVSWRQALTHVILSLTLWVSAITINYYYLYFIDERAKAQKSYLVQSHIASESESWELTLGSQTLYYFT